MGSVGHIRKNKKNPGADHRDSGISAARNDNDVPVQHAHVPDKQRDRGVPLTFVVCSPRTSYAVVPGVQDIKPSNSIRSRKTLLRVTFAPGGTILTAVHHYLRCARVPINPSEIEKGRNDMNSNAPPRVAKS